jgi:hypothetical protein
MIKLSFCQIESGPYVIINDVSVNSFYCCGPATGTKRSKQPERCDSKVGKRYFSPTGGKKVQSGSSVLQLNCLVLHPFHR